MEKYWLQIQEFHSKPTNEGDRRFFKKIWGPDVPDYPWGWAKCCGETVAECLLQSKVLFVLFLNRVLLEIFVFGSIAGCLLGSPDFTFGCLGLVATETYELA